MNRSTICLRLSPTALETITDLQREFGVTRTDVLRAALAVALKHRAEFRAILTTLKETR